MNSFLYFPLYSVILVTPTAYLLLPDLNLAPPTHDDTKEMVMIWATILLERMIPGVKGIFTDEPDKNSLM